MPDDRIVSVDPEFNLPTEVLAKLELWLASKIAPPAWIDITLDAAKWTNTSADNKARYRYGNGVLELRGSLKAMSTTSLVSTLEPFGPVFPMTVPVVHNTTAVRTLEVAKGTDGKAALTMTQAPTVGAIYSLDGIRIYF